MTQPSLRQQKQRKRQVQAVNFEDILSKIDAIGSEVGTLALDATANDSESSVHFLKSAVNQKLANRGVSVIKRQQQPGEKSSDVVPLQSVFSAIQLTAPTTEQKPSQSKKPEASKSC